MQITNSGLSGQQILEAHFDKHVLLLFLSVARKLKGLWS